MSLHLNDLREANAQRSIAWMGQLPGRDEMLFCSNELAGETGEACNAVKKLERARLGVAGGSHDLTNLGEELGDVVICADRLAQAAGLILSDCVRAKFNKTSEKHGFPHRL